MSNVAKIDTAPVKDKFLKIYKSVHQIANVDTAESFFEKEKFFFLKLQEENPKLKECSEMSIVGTFLEVIANGLSFEKVQGHVYVMGRKVKVGDQYEQRMSYEVAKNGTMYLVKRAGSVKDISDPVIVYKGDEIKLNTRNGIQNIDHSPAIPRQSHEILGGYCFVITPDNRRELTWFPIERIERLKQYSAKQNKTWDKAKNAYVEGNPNELYTSNKGQIDEGFFLTKVVKAALKNYSKIKIGINMVEDGAFVPEIEDTSDFETQLIEQAMNEADPNEGQNFEDAEITQETATTEPEYF